ncbi:MAG: hypothetical protein AB1634_00415 [Thermodesulfobacteriota bacterium]
MRQMVVAVVGALFLASGAWAQEPAVALEAQQEEAVSLFGEAFRLATSPERDANIERLASIYRRIIHDCPDVPLAQESSWRLIVLLIRDHEPPRISDALGVYGELLTRHPDTPVRHALDNELGRFLFEKARWTDLATMQRLSGAGEDLGRAQKLSPVMLFYYSEAKWQLGDRAGARPGFQRILEDHPQTVMAATAQERLRPAAHE